MKYQNVQFKKRFGQNFLKRDSIVKRIADVCSITKDDLVVEVGPGGAILTKELAMRAGRVLAYEVDKDLKEELFERLKNFSNVTILFQDFLESDIVGDIAMFKYHSLYFVSNVPYYITTPIMMRLIATHLPFQKICMMVQKEVGTRFTAHPGSRAYGSISVYLSYYYSVKKEFFVSRKEFVPVPNVDSVVISFERRKELLPLKDESLFFNLVRDSFQFKRKNLRNNLKKYDLQVISDVLKKYNYDLTVRAENLSVEIFVSIANALSL
ncbi:MAG TPA: ribosomal RNA small subunit methyltransferase A [Candidatus Faecimonas gallistercoris]|nr:ribosomal RNA small subunit methyltransferase A [Candidatus Faecimonas gallistercoris]